MKTNGEVNKKTPFEPISSRVKGKMPPGRPKKQLNTPETPVESPTDSALASSNAALAAEVTAIVDMCRRQRARIEKQLTREEAEGEKYVDPKTMGMIAELGRMVTGLLKEGRQLEKAARSEELTDDEVLDTLIAAGWTPPGVRCSLCATPRKRGRPRKVKA